MSRHIEKIILIIVCLAFGSCSGQKKCLNCGAVLYKQRIFNKETGIFDPLPYSKDRKLWYYDSLVIAEGLHIKIQKDINGNETWEALVNEYTFINLRTKSFYIYETFSDTARIIEKYTLPDSGRVKGGWNFFDTNTVLYPENIESLSDTLINGIKYKRIKSYKSVKKTEGEIVYIIIGYLRCDLKHSVFSIDKPFSNKAGCPLVRIENVELPKQSLFSFEIEFLPDKLTDKELKIFNAWKKNAEKNLVNK